MPEFILSVDKLSNYLKSVFDSEELFRDIYVRVEISGYNESGGNAFFSLKGKESVLNCVQFAADFSGFSQIKTRYVPKNGDLCIVKGSAVYYKKTGKMSFSVSEVKRDGSGDDYLRFLELKEKLFTLGVFDLKNKKPLPCMTFKAGVVTSRAGAVIHDIIKIRDKKFPSADILLYTVRVQGGGSENEIAEGVKALDGRADVIIVARGGGSEIDLMAFNTETVAMAVFNCKTPVISAVGHQTDTTLCDLAADVRAATPTEAAEIIFNSSLYCYSEAVSAPKRLYEKLLNKVKRAESEAASNIRYITTLVNHKLENAALNVQLLTNNISAHNPKKIFEKGYSYVTYNGKAVRDVKAVEEGMNVIVSMKGGSFESAVTKIKRGK